MLSNFVVPFLADRTNGLAYATVLLRPSVVSLPVVCIVAKRCVLLIPKICQKKQIGNGLWGIE